MQPPKEKTVYVSTTHPKIRIYVDTVSLVEADEESPACYFVDTCADGDQGDEGANGVEFTNEEWEEYVKEHGLQPRNDGR